MSEPWERYRRIGRFAEGFARGKMTSDPAYAEVCGRLEDRGTLVDVGCGEGYLLARVRDEKPGWDLYGFDHDARRLDQARQALEGEERIHLSDGDVRTAPLPRADAITCLDVLHYMPPEVQDDILARLAGALAPGALLLIRDGDAAGGWAASVLRLSERAAVALGRHKGDGVFLRPSTDTLNTLARLGLDATATPCNEGTPFANVLFLARKPL